MLRVWPADFVVAVLHALVGWVSVAWAINSVAEDFTNLAVRAMDGNFPNVEGHVSALDGRVTHVAESAQLGTLENWVDIGVGISRLKDIVLGNNQQTEQGECDNHRVENVSVGANSET
jgi:hypothetical protein